MKIVQGKAKPKDITKALDDAMKTVHSEYEKRISQSAKEQRIKTVAEQEAHSLVSAVETAPVKMCLLTTVPK